ncbi:PspA/IM30 family protein [Salisaeta longa]|uniref:PspA/IM30 family protein n=1 Tax=Salisaeta longa TaxID=503170 RepID=UPI0003B323B8|nr:PspA/IM30 family protein [Salisaeta longa]
MSVWSRFTRFVKSIFGGAVSAMENPRLILEQNIRELNDQVPQMNENIATVKANMIMLRKEHDKIEENVQKLTSRVQAAIQQDRDDIATEYAVRLEKERESLASTKKQFENARRAYDKALEVKKAFMREKERKIQEAKEALRAHERAKWQAEIADTLEQFEVGGMDQTHDEMIQQLDEQTAKNEARMELALDSMDTERMQIEEDAEKLRAQEVVKQMRNEMGLGNGKQATEDTAAADRLELPDEKESADEVKTIGKNRTSAE